MTDTVDAFIGSELAKQTEPKWRPCTVEFAFAHPTESEWQCGGDGCGWEPMTKPPGGYCPPNADHYEFRTKAPLPQQPDPLDARNPGRTYSARGERKVTAKFGDSLGFAGGREDTPRAEIVRSNYYNANKNEANIRITGQCSVETLRAILAWAESQLELVPDEDRCYPAPGWWRVK